MTRPYHSYGIAVMSLPPLSRLTGSPRTGRGLAPVLWAVMAATFLAAACEDQNTPANSTPSYEMVSDAASLPKPVARTREDLLKAARTGDVEELARVLQKNELKPILAAKPVSDPAAHWKAVSVDGEGRSVLAALIDVLEADGARINAGKEDELFIWPYFDRVPLDKLSPAQTVELYRLSSPEDVKTMMETKTYTHYRVGVGKDGTWHFFSKRPAKPATPDG